MDSPPLLLVPITISLSYLLLRMGQYPGILLPKRFRAQERLQSPFIAVFQKPATRKGTLLLALSFLLGAFAAWAWAFLLPVIPLLLILPALAFALDELSEPRRLHELPSALALIEQVKLHVAAGADLPEALGKAEAVLQNGPVKAATEKTLLQIEERLAMTQSLANLRGVTPFLDEFVSDSLRAGWQYSPALIITLELLLKRASAYWSRTGNLRARQDRLKPLLRFTRGFIAGGIVMGLALLFQPDAIPLVLILFSILAAMLLRFVLTSPVARRAVLAGTLILLLLSPTLFAPVAQAMPNQNSQQESPPAAKTITPEFIPHEPIKLRGTFVLPECQVRSGITEGFVNLRAGPGMHHPVLQVVPETEVLTYVGQTGSFEAGEWRQVRAGGQTGWIYAPLCKTAAELEEGNGKVGIIPPQIFQLTSPPIYNKQTPSESCQVTTGYADGWANLRSGPGMAFPVATTLPETTHLRYLEEVGDFYTTGVWYRVLAPHEIQGWIFSEICTRGGSGSS